MTVFYWLIISLLCSILMAVTLPENLVKIFDSNLVAGCALLLLGSIIVPRLMERKKVIRTREVMLAELSMLVEFAERKLIEMIGVIIVHGKVKNRYAEMVCPINRWSGEIGYWSAIGESHYDFDEREALTRAELHLSFANEIINDDYNEIVVFVKNGGLIQRYRRAEHVVMSLIFFLFYAKSILAKYHMMENKGYTMQIKGLSVSECVDIVLCDIPSLTNEERERLKKELPIK